MRKRVVVKLGSLEEVPNKKVASQKLGSILNPISDVKHKPRVVGANGLVPVHRRSLLVRHFVSVINRRFEDRAQTPL